ncbi:Crp/Fnr family transcriptional regulator [bacterium]|nr:Crp/Fnr family transcriptional regulator [bacterium]
MDCTFCLDRPDLHDQRLALAPRWGTPLSQPGEQFKELLSRCTATHFAAGDILFQQGEIPEYFFLVQHGLIKIKHSSSQGRDLTVEFLFPGDVCGALCALDGTPYPCTAICVSDAQVGRVTQRDFAQLVSKDPSLMYRACATCRDKMSHQRNFLMGLALEQADGRAARLLCLLALRLGVADGETVKIPRLFDRQALAEAIGTTSETAIRTLSKFRKNGWIKEKAKTLTLTNVAALRELAGLTN